MSLFLFGLGVILLGGLIAFIPGLPRRSESFISTVAMALGCALALAGTVQSFLGAPRPELGMPWAVPGAEVLIGLDPLSALFLVLHFVVAGSAVVFGHSYFRTGDGKGLPLPWVHFFFSLLIVSMAVTFSARHALLFLAAWEIMALSAFFLIIIEHHRTQVRQAGYLYLLAMHTGLLCLLAMFVLLGTRCGSYRFSAMMGNPTIQSVGTVVFLLALVGFGLKAGVMPFHIWLPEAHPAAPSPVSAIMSGVVIKAGIYGWVRVISFFPAPPAWWGLVLLILGVVSGVLGVLWALAQHDFKRLLAYHSVENIGIILIGLGIGFLGVSLGNSTVALLGLAGGLLHVVNHGLFKSLLFLGAGSVYHATGVRELDRLGGLWKKMPYTGFFILIGSAAICGLPPLNGFVSEWLVYLGSFHLGQVDIRPYFLLVAPALALIGALALACFTKAFATQFLGTPRSDAVSRAHESDLWMLGPMGFLSGLCALVGLFPGFWFRSVARSASTVVGANFQLNPGDIQVTTAALMKISWFSFGLVALVLLLVLLRRSLLPRPLVSESSTWACGYAVPVSSMQYTASSYAQFATSLFRKVLLPIEHLKAPDGYFPATGHFSSHTPDAVLDRFLLSVLSHGRAWIARLQRFHEGHVQSYLAYLLIFLLALLVWQFHGFSVLGRYLFLLDMGTAAPHG